MYCQKCKSEIPSGSKFCPNCGAAMSQIPESGSETGSVTVDGAGNGTYPQPTDTGKKKGSCLKWVVIVIVVIVVFIFIVAAIAGDDESDEVVVSVTTAQSNEQENAATSAASYTLDSEDSYRQWWRNAKVGDKIYMPNFRVSITYDYGQPTLGGYVDDYSCYFNLEVNSVVGYMSGDYLEVWATYSGTTDGGTPVLTNCTINFLN